MGTSRLRRRLAVVVANLTAVGGVVALAATPAHAAPANDMIANATSLGSAPSGSVEGSNVGATAESGEQIRDARSPAASVWWRWTAGFSGTATFDTLGSGFDTVLGAQAGTAIGGTLLAANDDIDFVGEIPQSRVSFEVTEGSVYSIAVDGFNGAAGDITLNWSLVDTAKPSVTINKAAGQADPTSSSPINFTVEFSEPVSSPLAAEDVVLSGTAGATTKTVTGSFMTYNVAVSGMTGPGTVVATVPAGGTSDSAGNTNTASTSTDNSVLFDPTKPSVTINKAASQADPTGTSPINFTVVFTEPVTGFALSDVTLAGSAGATTKVVTGSGTTYNVAVSGMTGSGTVVATVPAGGAADAAGNTNNASTSTDNSVQFNTADVTKPSVTINQAAGQADPAGTSPINFTAVFTEPVTGFVPSDVFLAGSAGATTKVVTGSGTTYNVAVSGMTGLGTVVATVPAGGAADAAGNTNNASTSTDNSVQFNGAVIPTIVPGAFRPVGPARLLDTRGGPKVLANGMKSFQVTGRGGVPAVGVGAVVLNVTVTEPAGGGFVTAFPTGENRPNASNLNFVAGQTSPNHVTVKVGADGKVSLFNGAAGTVHLIADVFGWYRAGTATEAGMFTPISPQRLVDTRIGIGAPKVKVAKYGTLPFQVTGRAGIPGSGVGAGVFNVTVTQPMAGGFITAFPNGTARPNASNLNFSFLQTVPNAATVKLGADGKVALYNGSPGASHLFADVAGWFRSGTATLSGAFTPLNPARVLDTRAGVGAPKVKVGAGKTVTLKVAGVGGVPGSGAGGVVLNTTVTNTTSSGFITVFPAVQGRPNASNLNFVSGQTVANLVTVKLWNDGLVSFYNGSAKPVDLLADVAGWYKG